MRYIFSVFITLLACASSVQARQTITIVYPFPNESITNIYRVLASEANKIQEKYNFIVDIRPGAGGSIASNHVLNTPNTILAHTSAFFVRPNIYPRESHDLKQFQFQYVLCMVPMAVSSSKYQSWKDVPKSRPLNVGTSGLGVTSHLITMAITKNFPNIHVVPFKSTGEALLGMISDSVDLQVGFIAESEKWRDPNPQSTRRVNILGITGNQTVNGHQPLSSQGFDPDLNNMTLIMHLAVPVKYDQVVTAEWHDIFDRAAKTNAVRSVMANDHCMPNTVRPDQLDKFYATQVSNWRRFSERVRIN